MNAPALSQDRIFSELDHARISRLARQHMAPDGTPPVILDIFDEGELLAPRDMPADVVTMYSQVVADDAQGNKVEVALCYPPDADPTQGRYSVMSPIGAGLLGRRVGETAAWTNPDGTQASLRIRSLRFQPEASGNYTM